jgi:hypothetical protein
MSYPSIMPFFNKFAGREVQVVETTSDIVIGGQKYTLKSVRPVEDDPVIQAMKDTAVKNGIRLRIWFPGSPNAPLYDLGRVNAHIVKGRDNKYRVSCSFNIG